MSVDLPAPFSPSSAWTSPGLRSKSTPSLATIDPKRFVIPRSSRALLHAYLTVSGMSAISPLAILSWTALT